jgi:hypothetical protein
LLFAEVLFEKRQQFFLEFERLLEVRLASLEQLLQRFFLPEKAVRNT